MTNVPFLFLLRFGQFFFVSELNLSLFFDSRRVALDVEAHRSEIEDEIKFRSPLRLLSWICDALVEKEDEVLTEKVV
jgi:hypothetical protein